MRYTNLARKTASWEGGRAALPRPLISASERAPADLIVLTLRAAVYLSSSLSNVDLETLAAIGFGNQLRNRREINWPGC